MNHLSLRTQAIGRRRLLRTQRPACARCGFAPRRTRVHLQVAAGDEVALRWLCRFTAHCVARRRAVA